MTRSRFLVSMRVAAAGLCLWSTLALGQAAEAPPVLPETATPTDRTPVGPTGSASVEDPPRVPATAGPATAGPATAGHGDAEDGIVDPDASPPSRHRRRLPEEAPPAAGGIAARAGTARTGWHTKAWLYQRVVADSASLVEATGPQPSEALRLTSPLEVEARSRAGAEASWRSASGFVRSFKGEVELEIRSWDRPEPALRDGPALWRRASVEAMTLAGQFTLGRTQSTWGLGLLAHDGVEDPMQFGARRGSTTVTRLGYALLPAALWHGGDPTNAFPLALAVAYDWVARDDLAYYSGDKANNALAALLYRGTELQAGIYGVQRKQTDVHGLEMQARVVDGFFRWRRQASSRNYIEFSGEGVMLLGETGWLATPSQPDRKTIEQFGGVARVEVGNRRGSSFRLESGSASADSRPGNGTLRNFRMANDYRVGLVMFPVAQRLLSGQTVANLSDLRYSATAPAGVERVETHGAVTQATYVHPVLRVEPTRNHAILLGALWASSPSDAADPFRSWLAGGQAVGPRGAAGKRDLGLELDAAVESKTRLADWAELILRFDGGVWFPGDVFDDASGQPMAAVGAWQGAVQLRIDL